MMFLWSSLRVAGLSSGGTTTTGATRTRCGDSTGSTVECCGPTSLSWSLRGGIRARSWRRRSRPRTGKRSNTVPLTLVSMFLLPRLSRRTRPDPRNRRGGVGPRPAVRKRTMKRNPIYLYDAAWEAPPTQDADNDDAGAFYRAQLARLDDPDRQPASERLTQLLAVLPEEISRRRSPRPDACHHHHRRRRRRPPEALGPHDQQHRGHENRQ